MIRWSGKGQGFCGTNHSSALEGSHRTTVPPVRTTELIRDNANLYHVKELLGHESLSTLKPYTKVTITDFKKAGAKCHPRERDNE